MGIERIITITVLILALIILSTTTAAALSCNCGDICVNETGWWRDGVAFTASTTPIQAAVNNAGSGETICVASGSYTENVDITTPHLTLRGEGAGVVTVNAASSLDHVFEVTADYVNISGFNATGATGVSESRVAGFRLDSADHCNISENTASNSWYGICLLSSSNNTLVSNNASSNSWYGICLLSSSNNTLTGNNCSNSYYGILLSSSSNNMLTGNTANSNKIYGINLQLSNNNMLMGNTVSSNNGEGISLSSSSYNTLTGNNCSNNDDGIRLYSSSNNMLTDNTASDNRLHGIYLYSSSNYNMLMGNNCSNNTLLDIFIEDSDSTFTDNTLNGTTISFAYGGNISLKGVGSPAANPAGHQTIGKFISANDQSTGAWLFLNFSYSDADVSGLDESNLTIWKHNGTMWLKDGWNGARFLDTTGNIVGVNITSFSVFAPAAPELPDDITPPVITITTPAHYELYTVGMRLNFSATDSVSGVDTIAGNLTNTSGVSQIIDTRFEPEVGVYTLVVAATDNAGNTNESDPVFFVVYDPAGGRAKGKGWFYPDVEGTHPGGKADFKFTTSYKKDVSTGKLDFKDKDADIKLKSTSIDWLTISSVSAQFQGTGTINGDGLYTFRVLAKDNGKPGAGNDHFDIMIWNGIDTMADPDYKAKNTIADGDIKVHAK